MEQISNLCLSALHTISTQLDVHIAMHGLNITNPFKFMIDDAPSQFKNNIIEVRQYDMTKEFPEQPGYNFKFKDIEIYWVASLPDFIRPSCWANKTLTYDEIDEMLAQSLSSLTN